MAENAKNDAAAAEVAKKGRAKKKKTESVTKSKSAKVKTEPVAAAKGKTAKEVEEAVEVNLDANLSADNTATESTEAESTDEKPKKEYKTAAESTDTKRKSREEFQTEIREQIENCQFAIVAALQESIHKEVNEMANRRIRQVERRRRFSNFIHDIVIVILAVVVGYFGYCLYDAKYFDFLQPACEQEQNCEMSMGPSLPQEEIIVKDTAWYIQNYGNLFADLQIGLDATKVDAYYLYSDDYKVSEIQPAYLLGMAYNRLNLSSLYSNNNGSIVIPSVDMRTAFVDLFGSDDYFVRRNFVHGCAEFVYDRATDSFTAISNQCPKEQGREILEAIDEIYEEGNVLYILTTATIYDIREESFYGFNNLFKPLVNDVQRDDFDKYNNELNKYQYQFKKVNDNYYFSSVVKLK